MGHISEIDIARRNGERVTLHRDADGVARLICTQCMADTGGNTVCYHCVARREAAWKEVDTPKQQALRYAAERINAMEAVPYQRPAVRFEMHPTQCKAIISFEGFNLQGNK